MKGLTLLAVILVLGLNICAKGLDMLAPYEVKAVFAVRKGETGEYALYVMDEFKVVAIGLEPSPTDTSSAERLAITLLGKRILLPTWQALKERLIVPEVPRSGSR